MIGYKIYKEYHLILILSILISLILILVILWYYKYDYHNRILLTVSTLLLFGNVFFHVYRPRKCPVCKKRMQFSYSKGIIPEEHFCETCKIEILTHIGNSDGITG